MALQADLRCRVVPANVQEAWSLPLVWNRLSQLLYGKSAALLTQEQKEMIANLATLADMGAGAAVGGSTGAGSGAVAAKVEVENNALGCSGSSDPLCVGKKDLLITGGGIVGGGRGGGGSTKPGNVTSSIKESVRFIEGVTVKDIKTGQTFSGTVDVKPTLDRIASGGTNPHRNDGSVFKNLPDRTTGTSGLPTQPTGYYKEYVHPTPNISGPGPQRVIVGQNGEAYYTNDHYKTFIKIR